MGEKNANISENTHQIHSRKSYILAGRASTKVIQRIVRFEILDFAIFFRFR